MGNYNKSDIAKIILIMILVALNGALFWNGIQLDCDLCIVKFKNAKVSGLQLEEPILFAEYKAEDIFDEWKEGRCVVKFDRVQGYYYP